MTKSLSTHFFGCILVAGLQGSCKERKPQNINAQAHRKSQNSDSKQKSEVARSPSSKTKTATAKTPKTETKKLRLDPRSVTVSLAEKVHLAAAGVVEDLKVPTIEIDKGQADFIKILRCAAGYQLMDVTGTPLDKVIGKKARYESGRDAWALAISDYRRCNLIGEQIWSPSYKDIAAKSGNFFYVINPCITKKNSASKKQECSFNLTTTRNIKFKNPLEERLRKNLENLARATNKIERLTGELVKLARLLETRVEACEDYVARNNANKAFARGLTQMAIFASGVFLFERGGLLQRMAGKKNVYSFTGPNASVMVGLMAMNMGSMWITEAVGNTDMMSTCLIGGGWTRQFDVEVEKINANKQLNEEQKERSLAQVEQKKAQFIRRITGAQSPFEARGEKALKKYTSELGFLQDEYGVEEALQRIDFITSQHLNRRMSHNHLSEFPEPLQDKKDGKGFDGLLIAAILNYNKLIQESAAMDQSVMTLEQNLVEAQKAGIPVDNAQAMPGFLEQLLGGMGQ